MPKHHKLMILVSFFMGFITGVFGYFWSESKEETHGNSAPVLEEKGYELLVTAYGGCERIGCPSFRLQDDGTYQYLAPQSVRDYAKHEDTISERQNEVIAELVRTTDFKYIESTTMSGTCPVAYDGLAYRVEIRNKAERYSFDSCVEDLGSEPLFVELIKYFGIMEATHGIP